MKTYKLYIVLVIAIVFLSTQACGSRSYVSGKGRSCSRF